MTGFLTRARKPRDGGKKALPKAEVPKPTATNLNVRAFAHKTG